MYYENEVRLIGCLGADPEVRSFPDGGKLANLRLATTRRWSDRATGERREETEWHSVTVQNAALVGVVEKYARKGSYLAIRGRLRTRKWQDRDGRDRWSTEVVVAGYDGAIGLLDRGGGGGAPASADSPAATPPAPAASAASEIDDEIPF